MKTSLILFSGFFLKLNSVNSDLVSESASIQTSTQANEEKQSFSIKATAKNSHVKLKNFVNVYFKTTVVLYFVFLIINLFFLFIFQNQKIKPLINNFFIIAYIYFFSLFSSKKAFYAKICGIIFLIVNTFISISILKINHHVMEELLKKFNNERDLKKLTSAFNFIKIYDECEYDETTKDDKGAETTTPKIITISTFDKFILKIYFTFYFYFFNEEDD